MGDGDPDDRRWPEDGAQDRHKSKMRRTLSRWANSTDQHARELRQTVRESGLVAIDQAPDRTRVKLSGSLRTVSRFAS